MKPFEVEPRDLAPLQQEGAVRTFRELLHAEARRLGIPPTKCSVPQNVDAPDGGADAETDVDRDVIVSGELIVPGVTVFQIKGGDSYSPTAEGTVRNELFSKPKGGGEQVTLANLKPRIREVLQAGGRYACVCFGRELTADQRRNATGVVHNLLSRSGLTLGVGRVEVFGQVELAAMLRPFPAQCASITGWSSDALPFSEWRRGDDVDPGRRPLHLGEAQRRCIDSIREAVLAPATAGAGAHVRVLGEAGVGKSRLVLEALDCAELRPLVVYAADPDAWSGLRPMLLDANLAAQAVLVVDECGEDERRELFNLFARRPNVRVVSLSAEPDETGGERIVRIDVPPLEVDQVAAIIEGYGIPRPEAERFAAECDGSPRWAHQVGENLRANPDDDVLRPTAGTRTIDRVIAGSSALDGDEHRQRMVVLTTLSLFQKCGYAGPHLAEARAVALLASQQDPSITWSRFQQLLTTLNRRKIVQGDRAIYITPRLLHVWLWRQWWDVHAQCFDLTAFLEPLSPPMQQWFFGMWRYAAASPAASAVVRELLGPGGPFRADDAAVLEGEVGARFFGYLAEADPQAAVRCLEATLATWSDSRLADFRRPRQQIVWALERAAVHRDLFAPAARLLLRLAANENAGNSNNATGVFCGLFVPAPGEVATTELEPALRWPVLEAALESASEAERRVAVRACAAALNVSGYMRMSGAERQGLRPAPVLWSPRDPQEWVEAVRRAWQLLDRAQRQTTGGAGEAADAATVMLEGAGGLIWRLPTLDADVRPCVERLVEARALPEGTLLRYLVDLRSLFARDNVDGRDADVVAWVDGLLTRIEGDDFASRLRRWVGTQLWGELVAADVSYEEARARIAGKVAELAGEAVRHPELLREHLGWLTTRAERAGAFGRELALLDDDFFLLGEVASAREAASGEGRLLLLGGYFEAVRCRDPARWERELDAVAASPARAGWLAELTARSAEGALSAEAAGRIAAALERGRVAPEDLLFFRWGRLVASLDDDMLRRWLDPLLAAGRPDEAWVAVDLLFHARHSRGGSDPGLPADLFRRVVLNERLFDSAQDARVVGHVRDHAWGELAKAFVDRHAGATVEVLAFGLPHLGQEGTPFESGRTHGGAVLRLAAMRDADAAWPTVREALTSGDERHRAVAQFHIGHLLSDERNFVGSDARSNYWQHVTRESLFEWIAADPAERRPLVARHAPRNVGRSPDADLARSLLVRFGDDPELDRELLSSFYYGGWRGPMSEHRRRQKERAEAWLADEDHAAVRRFLKFLIEASSEDVERELTREERER